MARKLKLSDKPGVYFFVGTKRRILYIGKATSLRDRVRSYFSHDLSATRGEIIARMIKEAKTVRTQATGSVLEALVLESYLIKKHKPKYNTDEKDDKSFNHIIITKEDFPRVLLVRARELQATPSSKAKLATGQASYKLQAEYGPFPRGGELREAMKLIRKIFPFRDKCVPYSLPRSSASSRRGSAGHRSCFNRQIDLCPGVCTGEISRGDYIKQIRNLKLFLEGKKKAVVKNLEREMKTAAKAHEFERAGEIKRQLFALTHIQDVALMKREHFTDARARSFRIEAYDVAHLAGSNSVAVMTVVEDGEVNKNEYRKFRLRLPHWADDLAALDEVLERRFNHPEWRKPNLVIIDGGETHRKRALRTLTSLGEHIPTVSVVKDEHHRPRDILGERHLISRYSRDILLANSEAHRFAIKFHRESRGKNFVKS